MMECVQVVLPSCRDWHRVLTRALGLLSLFLVFGLECFPHEGQSSSLSKTHSHTHTQAKVNPWEHLLVAEDKLLLFVSVRVLFSVLLLPSSSHPLFMIEGLWATVPALSTRCQRWPVYCSLLAALTSLRVQLSCWTVSDSAYVEKGRGRL